VDRDPPWSSMKAMILNGFSRLPKDSILRPKLPGGSLKKENTLWRSDPNSVTEQSSIIREEKFLEPSGCWNNSGSHFSLDKNTANVISWVDKNSVLINQDKSKRKGEESMKGRITHAVEFGDRDYQEDRCLALHFKRSNFSGCLLAVLDGHGGSEAAEYCQQFIKECFPLLRFNIREAESQLEVIVAHLAEETRDYVCGTTLSMALIIEKPDRLSRVTVAVLGDSPVVILDQKGEIHVSPEHNVRSNKNEENRVLSQGAMIARGYLFDPKSDVKHYLQLSRALGDCHLDRILSRQPEIYTIRHPRWILVASDGLLDPTHTSLEEGGAGKIIRKFAQKSANALDLIRWAMEKNFGELDDNTTSVVWQMK
jgi:serine/threonine protein phosphatase PrpC